MELVLTALGAMKITDLFKQLLPWPPAAWVRSLVSGVAAAVLAVVAHTHPGKERALLWAGAWGLSALLHELGGLLSILADNYKAEVIIKASGRRR